MYKFGGVDAERFAEGQCAIGNRQVRDEERIVQQLRNLPRTYVTKPDDGRRERVKHGSTRCERAVVTTEGDRVNASVCS